MRNRMWSGFLLALALVGLGVAYYQLRDVESEEVVEGPHPEKATRESALGHESDAERVLVSGPACTLQIVASTNPASRKGIEDAQVRYLRHSPLMRGATVSGEDGTFELPSAGLYSVVVRKSGFAMLFVKALRCQSAGSTKRLALEKGTRLELSLYSGQSKPSADVDVLLLPSGVRASHNWRRSNFFRSEGILDQLEGALVRFSTLGKDGSKKREGWTEDVVEREIEQLLDLTKMDPVWLPYLASGFYRMRSNEAGLVVWDGIPADFRWGILANELTAEMSPPFEGRESRAGPGGGIIPARRVPLNLSGIVEERPGETIRLRAIVNVGNWVKARLVIPKGYQPLRKIVLLSKFQEMKNGQKLVRFVAEHRSEVDTNGVCVFHGVRPGPKVLKAWMELKEVPAYRFYSHSFDYKGGQLDLGQITADLKGGDAMVGVRVTGETALAHEITSFNMSLLLDTPKEVGGGHYKLDLEIQPGKLIRLDGQRGRRAYPTLKPILRRGASQIVLKRDMVPIPVLEPLHWISAEIQSPVLSKVRIEYAPGLGPQRNSIRVKVVSIGGGGRTGGALAKGAWAEFEYRSPHPGFFAYAVQGDDNGEDLAAGVASFQNGLARVNLQKGETLDVLVGTGRAREGRPAQPQWVRLVPEILVEKNILHSPWVKQAKNGLCRFKHLPVPGKYWIFVNDEKRKLIDFNSYREVDLR